MNALCTLTEIYTVVNDSNIQFYMDVRQIIFKIIGPYIY